MAEQYVSAFAIDVDGFFGMVGSGDDGVVRDAVGSIAGLVAEGRLLRATEADEVAGALREIVEGRADRGRAGGYGWVLELLGASAGEPLGSLVLPGRGWDRLEEVFRGWGLVTLAGLWGRAWGFPWRDAEGDADPWPFPMLASKSELDRIHAELAGFDLGRVHDDCDLFPDGDDDAEEITYLLEENLPAWVDGARERGRELLLVRDGGK